jgi:hypothetical protein
MGTNNGQQQAPSAYNNPQTAALTNMALQGTGGSGRGAGASSAVSQIAAALMANQRIQAWKQKNGVPTYNNPNAQPGAVTPGATPGMPSPGQLPLAAPQQGVPQMIPNAATAVPPSMQT